MEKGHCSCRPILSHVSLESVWGISVHWRGGLARRAWHHVPPPMEGYRPTPDQSSPITLTLSPQSGPTKKHVARGYNRKRRKEVGLMKERRGGAHEEEDPRTIGPICLKKLFKEFKGFSLDHF